MLVSIAACSGPSPGVEVEDPIPDQSVVGQVYRNAALGMEIQYPQGWAYQEADDLVSFYSTAMPGTVEAHVSFTVLPGLLGDLERFVSLFRPGVACEKYEAKNFDDGCMTAVQSTSGSSKKERDIVLLQGKVLVLFRLQYDTADVSSQFTFLADETADDHEASGDVMDDEQLTLIIQTITQHNSPTGASNPDAIEAPYFDAAAGPTIPAAAFQAKTPAQIILSAIQNSTTDDDACFQRSCFP